jgi:predicted metalloprotease with PDZ domain
MLSSIKDFDSFLNQKKKFKLKKNSKKIYKQINSHSFLHFYNVKKNKRKKNNFFFFLNYFLYIKTL